MPLAIWVPSPALFDSSHGKRVDQSLVVSNQNQQENPTEAIFGGYNQKRGPTNRQVAKKLFFTGAIDFGVLECGCRGKVDGKKRAQLAIQDHFDTDRFLILTHPEPPATLQRSQKVAPNQPSF